MALTLGIDVGTYESKGVLVDGGRVVAEARHPHGMRVPRPGWAEHDAEGDWWGDTVRLCRALLAGPGVSPADVQAVAVSAIGPCLQAMDRDGRAVGPGILYGVDARASAEIAELNALIGEDAILERGGNALTSQAVGPKALWLRRNRPDVWEQADRLGTSTTFIVRRLTGETVMDHYTAANWAPLYDVEAQGWAENLHDVCPPEMLPRLLWSAEVAGGVTAEAAETTGLPEGTPVTTGTIDAAAEAVSVGVAAPGDMMLMYGSTVFVIALTPARVTDPRLWTAPWLFPGQHAAMAGLATSGTLTQWFREVFAPDLSRDEAFGLLAAEAEASPPGAKGLLCLPYFSGERTPLHDPQARGVFFGLNLLHGRGDLYRAVLEGIAAATRHVVDTYREAGAPPARVLAVGGGTRTAAWLQATSDMTGLDQALPTVTTGAAFGDAYLAALAIGAAAPRDIAAWNPSAGVARARHVEAYEASYPLFRALYEQTRDLMRALP